MQVIDLMLFSEENSYFLIIFLFYTFFKMYKINIKKHLKLIQHGSIFIFQKKNIFPKSS